MERRSKTFEELLQKYKDNTCTQKELDLLLEKISDHPESLKQEMAIHWQNSNRQTVSIPQQGKRRKRIQWSIAASFLVIVASALLWYSAPMSARSEQVYTTGNGETTLISLQDGSEIMLNANSTLIVSKDFDAKISRDLSLEGEAYFKVAKSIDKEGSRVPFTVHTDNLEVEVLGTVFNVASRPLRGTQVFLEEGQVQLALPNAQKEVMQPGELAVFNQSTQLIEKESAVSISEAASWVTGILNFHDQTLIDVIAELEVIFGHKITCDPSVDDQRKINLGVPYLDWENTKRALELALELSILPNNTGYYVTKPLEE